MTQSGPFIFTRDLNGVQPSGSAPFRFTREGIADSNSGTPTRWERSTPVVQILGPNYQLVIDLLSSKGSGPNYQHVVDLWPSAASTLGLSSTASEVAIFVRSAATTIEFDIIDFVNRNYDVIADNTLELSSTAAEVVAYMANAATTVEFSTVNTRFRETFQIATTMVEFGVTDALNHNLDVTADNTINLGSAAIGAPGGIPVAAFTTVEFDVSMPTIIVNNEIFATASTNVEFGTSATQTIPTIVVDATNNIEFAISVIIVNPVFLLSASSDIEFSAENTRDRVFEVSANTTLGLSTTSLIDMEIIVGATTSIAFGQEAFHVVKFAPSSRQVRFTTIRNISNGIVTLNLILSRRGLTITPQDTVEVNAAELDTVQINKLRGDFVITVDPF